MNNKASQLKLSEWFNLQRDGNPALAGWYEVAYGHDERDSLYHPRRYFDGTYWRSNVNAKRTAYGNVKIDRHREYWRGLAENPDGEAIVTSHELARLLLTMPDLPVATHAMNQTYISAAHRISHGSLKIGILESYAGQHIIIGDISKRNLNRPNWGVSQMLHGEAPEEWLRWDVPGKPMIWP